MTRLSPALLPRGVHGPYFRVQSRATTSPTLRTRRLSAPGCAFLTALCPIFASVFPSFLPVEHHAGRRAQALEMQLFTGIDDGLRHGPLCCRSSLYL